MNLMKNQIIQKLKSLEILKENVARKRVQFFLPFDKKLCSMGSKCLTLDVGHVQKITLPKKMLGYPMKLILGFSKILCNSTYKPKYS
jgi:hypothetical protein